MPADFEYTQGGLPFQVVFRMPQRGLILYSIWSCRPIEERDDDKPPIIIEKPRFELKGDPKSPSEPKGKGNGEPGKGDRTPGRTPGRDQPQQPTFRLPRGPIWDKVYGALAIIGGLVALFSLWGKVGALLGLLARALGFTLGLVGGAVAAAAGTPGKTGGPPVVKPVPGSVTTPGRTTGAKKEKPAPAEKAPQKAAPAAKAIKVKLIEGLNTEQVAVGMVFPVQFHEEGGEMKGIAILQVTNVIKDENGTTVEFTALQERMGGPAPGKDKRSMGGKKTYTVTHPYRVPEAEKPGLVGNLMYPGQLGQWFWKYLENLANELETAGHKNLANQVRMEVQRLKQLAARQSP